MPEQRILLKVDDFDRITTEIGLRSDLARAKHIGVSHTTIGRLREGGAAGGHFIASALRSLNVQFEELFTTGSAAE